MISPFRQKHLSSLVMLFSNLSYKGIYTSISCGVNLESYNYVLLFFMHTLLRMPVTIWL